VGIKEAYYPESKFGGFTDVDSTLLFYVRVNALIHESSVVLDIGCGRGAHKDDPVPLKRELQTFKGKVKKIIGLDVDPVAAENPYLDEFLLLKAEKWPLEDNSVDLCVSMNVVEHLEDPDLFFSEARRVLKDGGYICLRTPNVWSYFGIASRLIPNKFHAKVLKKVQENRQEFDVFPTLYRCNSLPKMRATLTKYGFDHSVYGYEAEPSYLSFSKIAYLFGVLHQKLAPRFICPAIFAFGKVHK
jgi:SAM-dependent methyltransferase